MESVEANTTVGKTLSKMSSWIEDPGVEEFNGLDMTKLKMDQAYITVASEIGQVGVYGMRDDCYRCPFELVHRTATPADTLVVDVARGFTWRLYQNVSEQYIPYRNKSGMLCEIRPAAGQFGVYRLDAGTCELETLHQPVNIYLPLLMLVLVLAAMGLLYSAGSLLVSYFQKKGKLRYAEKELSTKLRIRSLDTFRGLTIIMMIFVNDGAGGYWFLEHATWNGLAVADLVFPFFLWIMGVCIPISIKSTFTKGVPRYKTLLNIFRRSCILFLLGLSLNTLFGARLDTLRVPGVLQRFAITYFFAATIYLYTTKKYHTYPRSSFGLIFKDIYILLPQWVLHLLIVALHTAIVFKVTKPGCPAGYMGPGGKHDNWAYENCTGGATGYVDELILGNNHIFQNPAIRTVFSASPFDPEGILGSLTSIFQVFLGIQAGCTMQHFKEWRPRVVRWMIWAVILALVGGVLCGFSREIGIIPINKQLWSLSFTLVTSSFAFFVLTICYLLVDVAGIWSGAPCLHAGMNAILLYVGHMLCWAILPFHWSVPNMRTHFMQLFENVWGTALWVALAIFLARKKIFLTV